MIFKVVVVAVGTRITALAIIYATCTNFSYTSLMYFSVQIQISKSHSISAIMSFFMKPTKNFVLWNSAQLGQAKNSLKLYLFLKT